VIREKLEKKALKAILVRRATKEIKAIQDFKGQLVH